MLILKSILDLRAQASSLALEDPQSDQEDEEIVFNQDVDDESDLDNDENPGFVDPVDPNHELSELSDTDSEEPEVNLLEAAFGGDGPAHHDYEMNDALDNNVCLCIFHTMLLTSC